MPGTLTSRPAVSASRPRFPATTADLWAASYDRSQLQPVLYGPVHDAVLRYARQHILQPDRILDVGCGTGRLPAQLASGYRHARVVGVDVSTGMISNVGTAVSARASFAAAAAEQLPFADAAFDLVVVTPSVSHWRDQAIGLAEIGRVMAPDATLVVADVSAGWRSQPLTAWARRSKPWLRHGLPLLIAGSGFHVEHVEPIRTVAHIVDAALVRRGHPPARQEVAGACPRAPEQQLRGAIIVGMPDLAAHTARPSPAAAAPDELVDTVLAASRALVAVAARSLAAAGDEVTLPQYRALVVLTASGPQGTADLAAALAVNPSTATRLCDRLVRKGLVRRHRQAGDRRTVRITLTAAGRDLVAAVTKRRRAELAGLLGVLPQAQHEPVIAAFQAFAEAAGEIPAPGAALGWAGQ